jgi:hypothetical protein
MSEIYVSADDYVIIAGSSNPVIIAAGSQGPQGIPGIGIKGDPGEPGSAVYKGDTGASAYELAVINGFIGTEAEWILSLVGVNGIDGKSAYQIAVDEGFIGTEAAWLLSLVGAAGENSTVAGPKGDKGDTGNSGADSTIPGSPGSVWRDGSGVPSNSLGINNDYYLDDATGNVYLKAAGSYIFVANIKGNTGSTGATGSAGLNSTIAGPQGNTGTRGSLFLGSYATVGDLPTVNGTTVMAGDFAYVTATGELWRA